MSNKSRGTVRERQVAVLLMGDGWVVYRAAGSHGCADLVALRNGDRPRLVQVKGSAASPYEHFPPSERVALVHQARRAGADAWLCWWPPRRQPRWVAADLWPLTRANTPNIGDTP
jgi:Holliday junction resolvase